MFYGAEMLAAVYQNRHGVVSHTVGSAASAALLGYSGAGAWLGCSLLRKLDVAVLLSCYESARHQCSGTGGPLGLVGWFQAAGWPAVGERAEAGMQLGYSTERTAAVLLSHDSATATSLLASQ